MQKWRLQYILFLFSFIYGCIVAIRNWLFHIQILKTTKVAAKVIAVGNLAAGGTGKSPHVAFLANELKPKYKLAILLRGYGRSSTGFIEVTTKSTVEEVGDEALNYFNQLADTKVFVCEKRVVGAQQLLKRYPDIDLILLDDAYQHRYIYRNVNILLTTYSLPYFKDYMLPSGQLREFRVGRKRADITIVTKTPEIFLENENKDFVEKLKLPQKCSVFFSGLNYGSLYSLFETKESQFTKNILLVTGIGNPKPLLEYLASKANVKLMQFADHHQYTRQDIAKIHKIFDTFAPADKMIVTTEKDAARLRDTTLAELLKEKPWTVQSMTVAIAKKKELLENITYHVGKN